MRRLTLALLLIAAASSAASAWDPLQSARRAAAAGQRALAEGDTTSAIRDMMRAQALAPEDPEIRMGLGETLYRATEYESAKRQYESIGADPAAGIPATALYNAGNSAFDAGDLEAALDLYTGALLESGGEPSADLLHNLELTQRLLQQQQEQEEQSGQDQSDEQNEDSGEQQDQPDQQQEQQQDQQDQEQQQQDQQQQEQEQQQQDQQQAPPEEQEQPSEPEEQPAGEQEQQMSPEEAMRLLQALDADEEELRKSIQRRLRGDEKETEHDW
jgi:Flp pilus assembly protein TadD